MTKWLAAALDYLPRWLEFQVREGTQPGCAIAVAHRGKLVLEHAFGVANVDTGARLTPIHRFRVASHSKSFTAAGIMRLRDTHKLRLDNAVGTYVEALKPRIARTTLRQLLSHGSGICRDGTDSGQWNLQRPFLTERELRSDLLAPPILDADRRFKYSNHAFGLLGFVIEAITGERYVDWIQREVVKPAGLVYTTADAPIKRGIPVSSGHSTRLPFGRRHVLDPNPPTNALASATGFVSTAADLVHFFSQLDPRAKTSVLSVRSRREMTRLHRPIPGVPAGREYGLGLIRGVTAGAQWFGHSGAFPGFITRTSVLPADELAISVLTNSIDGPAQLWVDGAIEVLRAFARRGAPSPIGRGVVGRWWTMWGVADLLPIGNRVVVARPALTNPLLGASELTVRGDRGRITEADGFGSFGEVVRMIRTPRGTPKALWLAGVQHLPEGAFTRRQRSREAAHFTAQTR